MLENQKKFIEYTNKAESILSPICNEKEFTSFKELQALKHKLHNIELIVPIAGGFSAGKSSLINAFLGKDILPVAITPETSIPAELRYDKKERIEAIIDSENKDEYGLTDFEEIKEKAEKYEYIRVYLNNDNLKDIEPLTLVDMPGFSSPNKNHSQAIANYSAKGNHFIFLNDVKSGTIQNDIFKKLEEITEKGKGVSFCLSKTNLEPQSKIEEIEEYVSEQLEDIDGFDGKIHRLNDNSGENVKKIIKAIDPETLMKKIFINYLQDNHFDNESFIKNYIEDLSKNSEDLNEEINEIEKSFNKIEQQRENAIKEAKSKDIHTTTDFIINRITKIIMENSGYLADVALRSQYQFQNELDSMVRNNLESELKKQMEEMNNKIIFDFKSQISSLNALNGIDPHFVDEIVEKIQRDTKKSDVSIDLTDVVSVLSTLSGLFSGTIGVIIKQVLKVLSDIPILGKLFELFGSNNDDEYYKAENAKTEAKNKIRNIIETEVVTNICTSLKREIPRILGSVLEKMIETIAAEFEKQLNSEKASRKEALETKKAGQQKIELEKQQLENALTQLNDLKKQYF